MAVVFGVDSKIFCMTILSASNYGVAFKLHAIGASSLNSAKVYKIN